MHQSSPPRRPTVPVSTFHRQAQALSQDTQASLRPLAKGNDLTASDSASPSSSSNGRRQSVRASLASGLRRLREAPQSKPIDQRDKARDGLLLPGQTIPMATQPLTVASEPQHTGMQILSKPSPGSPLPTQRSLLGSSIVAGQEAVPVQKQQSLLGQLRSGKLQQSASVGMSPHKPADSPKNTGDNSRGSAEAGWNPTQQPKSLPMLPSLVKSRSRAVSGIPVLEARASADLSAGASMSAGSPASSSRSPVQAFSITQGSASMVAALGIEVVDFDGASMFGLTPGAMLLLGAAGTHPATGRVLSTGQG